MRRFLDPAAALGIVFLAAQAWCVQGDPGREGGPGASLIDGTEVSGRVLSLGPEGALLEGAPARIPLEDIREIRLASPPATTGSPATQPPGTEPAALPAGYFAAGQVT